MDDTYNAIHAMFVLHNICIDIGDTPEDLLLEEDGDRDVGIEIGDFNDEMLEEEENGLQWDNNEELKQAGYAKRLQLLDDIYPL